MFKERIDVAQDKVRNVSFASFCLLPLHDLEWVVLPAGLVYLN